MNVFFKERSTRKSDRLMTLHFWQHQLSTNQQSARLWNMAEMGKIEQEEQDIHWDSSISIWETQGKWCWSIMEIRRFIFCAPLDLMMYQVHWGEWHFIPRVNTIPTFCEENNRFPSHYPKSTVGSWIRFRLGWMNDLIPLLLSNENKSTRGQGTQGTECHFWPCSFLRSAIATWIC